MSTVRPLRLAMWSGPRNISTAMMRSWGNRRDTFVLDEPLYAYYLKTTKLPHPGADEVIASQETDWRRVFDAITGDVPEGKPIYYQKHMSHHLPPDVDRGRLDQLTNAFLIREPIAMLTSLTRFIPEPTARDTGLPQQVEIFDAICKRTGVVPPVVDSRDVLENPRSVLGKLCEAVGVAFDEAMLTWPPGRRSTDGVWAKYWYDSVERSTGFEPYVPKTEAVPDRLLDLLKDCQEIYQYLYKHRILP